jgi:hypothetical protein
MFTCRVESTQYSLCSSTWKLWAALGALTIIVGNLVGAQMITAIFQEGPPLKWKPAMIGYFDVVQMAAHGFATLVILPLLVALSLPDVATALIGVVFNAAVGVLTGFVHQSWQMFLIATVSAMEAVISPSVRSFMSKLVSAGNQGKCFSPLPLYRVQFMNFLQELCLHLLHQLNCLLQLRPLPSIPISSQSSSAAI